MRPPDLEIEFRDRQRTAIVRRPVQARLRYAGSDWMFETWRGGGYVLTMDPEVRLEGHGLDLGTCN